jgi:hypothetical protein
MVARIKTNINAMRKLYPRATLMTIHFSFSKQLLWGSMLAEIM